jgi:hypothetical protein
MNNNLPGELIGELIAQYENDGFNDISDSEMMRALYELQQYRKAAGEPVVSVIFKGGWPEPNSAAPIAGSQALLDGVHEFYLGSQPAPVFPNEAQLRDLFEAWFASDCSFDRSPEATDDDNYAWKESLWHTWQQCRAAMLNHSGEVSEKVDVSLINEGNNQAGNSPVIPDGYALVPIEPTESMVIEGFESEPDAFFSNQEDWEKYKAMSGCQQAAFRARLCWAAMIAAALKQEVKS